MKWRKFIVGKITIYNDTKVILSIFAKNIFISKLIILILFFILFFSFSSSSSSSLYLIALEIIFLLNIFNTWRK